MAPRVAASDGTASAAAGRSRARPGMAALCAGMALLPGCAAEERSSTTSATGAPLAPTRGYVLISFDTLRADHLGAYGYRRDTSPVFDRLAERALLFERAVAQYPSTLTSHMTIFTGVYPQEHQVLPPSGVLAEAIETLPERFQAHGFRTAGHTEGGFVAGGYGFQRGFDEFSDTAHEADTDIERTFERGLEFLRGLDDKDRFFLFLHTYSTHDPYEPPEAYRALFWEGEPPATFDSRGENLRRVNQGDLTITPENLAYFEAQYDASIRYADEVLGRFVDELEDLGLLKETTLVLTSDHGEEFGEHGRVAHTQVYPECLFVPLLLVHPEVKSPMRVGQVVETVDIAPTLYDLAGLPPNPRISGRSLMRLLGSSGSEGHSSQGYAEVFDVETAHTLIAQDRGRRFQVVLVEPEWDPAGAWIRDRLTLDTEGPTLAFEAHSFHSPRRVRVEVDGRPWGEIELAPAWTPVEIELPAGDEVRRVTLAADGCISPAEVGTGDDDRCLAFRVRNFQPRRLELYDLVSDPRAQVDLFRSEAEIRRRLADRLLTLDWRPLAEADERSLSEEEEEALRALGYLD